MISNFYCFIQSLEWLGSLSIIPTEIFQLSVRRCMVFLDKAQVDLPVHMRMSVAKCQGCHGCILLPTLASFGTNSEVEKSTSWLKAPNHQELVLKQILL